MEIESHFVFGAICVLLGLGHRFIYNARHAWILIVCNLDIRVGAQIVNACRLVH